MQRQITTALAAILLLSSGCMQLDGAVHNARHCSILGPEHCEDESDEFSKLCTPCDEAYTWDISPPWPSNFLENTDLDRLRAPANVTQHTIKTEDGEGELDLYVIPSHGEHTQTSNITLLLQHGNYAGIEHYIPRVLILHELGFEVIIWDYRGYGKSLPDTTPNPDQFMADARQIRDLADTLKNSSNKLVIYGMSLGALPSVEMALHNPPCAMVLETPFTSFAEITKTNTATSLGSGFLSQGDYENDQKIKEYTNPLLVFHASEDNLFPEPSVRKVYDNAGSTEKRFRIIEGAHHGVSDGVPETAGFTTYSDMLMFTLMPACQ